jgi:molybdate transport system regulatory protein
MNRDVEQVVKTWEARFSELISALEQYKSEEASREGEEEIPYYEEE